MATDGDGIDPELMAAVEAELERRGLATKPLAVPPIDAALRSMTDAYTAADAAIVEMLARRGLSRHGRLIGGEPVSI